jgi:hypothetical protein
MADKLFCGAVATLISQTVLFPLDVLRRRMQLCAYYNQQEAYRTLFCSIKTVYSREGIGGFYKGSSIMMAKIAPAMAISFVTYQVASELLK